MLAAEVGETRRPIVTRASQSFANGWGRFLGVSDWTDVVQEDITTDAKPTGDEQYIHVDPERAAKGPFGTTVQHGFLTF